jgi:hypothetical protein
MAHNFLETPPPHENAPFIPYANHCTESEAGAPSYARLWRRVGDIRIKRLLRKASQNAAGAESLSLFGLSRKILFVNDAPQLRPEERELALQQRRLARDRVRVIGMLAIIVFILLLAFFRFGRTIPWGAR